MGDGSNEDRMIPVRVLYLDNILSISARGGHNLALQDCDTIWAWGYNNYKQLGDDTTINRNTPMIIDGLKNIKLIICGPINSFAVDNNDTLWGWGNNHEGQLGNGGTKIFGIPIKISCSGFVKWLSAGTYYTIIFGHDDTLRGFGRNINGQLGELTTEQKIDNCPLLISNFKNIKTVSCGYYHTIAVKKDGTVWSWGNNEYGQIGIGSTTNTSTPTKIPTLFNIQSVACGYNHTLALNNNGEVLTWGNNINGQLGDGSNFNRSTPVLVKNLKNIVFIDGGEEHTIALTSNGDVWAWGKNEDGQLGDGTNINRSEPVMVSNLSDVKLLAAGSEHNLALKNDGTLWAWGNNDRGQLGDISYRDRNIPVKVSEVKNFIDIIKIAADDGYSGAITKNGDVWAWGRQNEFISSSIIHPAYFIDISKVQDISCGKSHMLAIKEDNSVWAWGGNNYGQLGDNAIYDQTTTPVSVEGLSNIQMIATGNQYSMALKDNSSVWVWGANFYGKLGVAYDILKPYVEKPVMLNSIWDVKFIDCGYHHSVALKKDGSVWSWGYNRYGQLGTGDTWQPRQVKDLDLFTIPKELKAIIVPNKIQTIYGNAIPDVQIEYQGFDEDDDIGDIREKPVVNKNATNLTKPGQYTITLSGGYAENYYFVYENATLEILPAKLTVLVKDIELNFSPDISISPVIEYYGFKNGDTIYDIDITPQVSIPDEINSTGVYPLKLVGGARLKLLF